MGIAGTYTPEKLVMGILSSREEDDEALRALLIEGWGAIDFSSASIPFTFTRYYEKEMGASIFRRFLSFERLVDPSCLAQVKLSTNAIEDRFRDGERRRVNLDPGLMALSRFTLATTKENAHRIPLSGGIFAEITLLYSGGSFQALAWTYPDFRSVPYLTALNEIRSLYKTQLRSS